MSHNGRTVIAANVVITADPTRRVLTPGWVAVVDGRIAAVEAGDPLPADAATAVRADVLMPGLVSAHQHLVDVLVRGGPIGPTFHAWLLGSYHAGLSLATPEECHTAIGVVRAAGLAAGITTVVDCWSVGAVDDASRWAECAHASVGAHLASGGRTVFGSMFCEVIPPGWGQGFGIDPERLCRPVDESLALVAELSARYSNPAMVVTPSPEIPELSTAGGLRAAHDLAQSLGAKLPMHVCASPPSRAAYGPAELDAVGLLGPDLLAAHCSWVDDDDIAAFGHSGIGVAHCPSASRALGSTRSTPLADLRRAGAVGGLGLDNASLHGSSDLFAEARQAALGAAGQGRILTAHELLDLVTIEGARAAGLDDRCGAVAVGLFADLITVDTSRAHWWPRGDDWVDTVMRCARADDVTTVMVAGEVVAARGATIRAVDHQALDAAAKRIRGLCGW